MAVKLSCRFGQWLGDFSELLRFVQQLNDGVVSFFPIEKQQHRFESFLGSLLRLKSRPFVISVCHAVSSGVQVALCLIKPIFVTSGHKRPFFQPIIGPELSLALPSAFILNRRNESSHV